jgi:sigma-E factor negative regulatory protein RseC
MNETAIMPAPAHSIEGIARVVHVEDGIAWLEPEQTTSCGSCASAAACGAGATGIGTVARRLEQRRFALGDAATPALRVGERIVVGVDARALIKAALTAYGLPLALALAAGGIAHGGGGGDIVVMASMLSGLGLGVLAARMVARRLRARGELAPRFLRRAGANETCGAA